MKTLLCMLMLCGALCVVTPDAAPTAALSGTAIVFVLDDDPFARRRRRHHYRHTRAGG